VSPFSDISCFYLEISGDLEISGTVSTGALRKRNILRDIWFVDDLIDYTVATTGALTCIIKEDYFCKWGTTKSKCVGMSSKRSYPARSLLRLIFSE
jgi:hypothetical protein